MTPNATLVQMLQMSSWQLEQVVSEFDADQWFYVPAEGIASAAWIVGHAMLIDRQILEEPDVPSLPEIPDDWRALYQTRPEDGMTPEDYPGRTILDRFLTHRRALVAAVSRIAPQSARPPTRPTGPRSIQPVAGGRGRSSVRLRNGPGNDRQHVALHVPACRRGGPRAPIAGNAR